MSKHCIQKISNNISLNSLIGLDEIKMNLKMILNNPEPSQIPHFYFYGSPGTGKTSTTLSFLRELCSDENNNIKNVYLFNLSYMNGVDFIRNNIVNLCKYKNDDNNPLDIKFIILDEFDSMSQDAQTYISYCMRQYPKIRFFFISNTLDTILPIILENSTIVHFDCYKEQDYIRLIQNIIPENKREQSLYNRENILKYCHIGNYDMRKIKNIINIEPDIINLELDDLLLDKNDNIIIKTLEEYIKKGYNYSNIFSFYKNQIKSWKNRLMLSDIEFKLNENIHYKNVFPCLVVAILDIKKLKHNAL
jgi:DNA polymerase III delta prime subunit